jgi:hypothetical protein
MIIMMKRSLFAVALLLSVFSVSVRAQCSDAGVCSLDHAVSSPQHSLTLNYVHGRGASSEGLTFHSLVLDGSFRLFESSRLIASVPWSAQYGPLGSVRGVGDLVVAWDQTVITTTDGSLGVQAGLKLATARVNRGGLPQRYQSGLGSNDLLFGLSYASSTWFASVGYQATNGRSANEIDMLRRGDDAMLRVGYQTTWEEMKPSVQLLAIKRLGKSNVVQMVATRQDEYLDLPGSDQFQINVLGSLLLPVSEEISLNVMAAVPLLQRDVNVDGLTRSITLGSGIVFSF